jgi:DNA-binding transcriptional LysR family regulator
MEVFRAVMVTGSINGAAKLLFISQPAISRMIAHTEQSLGFTLFNRTKGKLIPTFEGEALFREVETLYQTAMRVDEFAIDLAKGPTGTLNVCSSPCLSYAVMPEAIARFTQRYPRIGINYHTALMHTMAAEVLSNKVDLLVSVQPLEHPNLTVESFMSGRMVCVVPDHHALASLEVVSLADLANHPLITHHENIQFGQMVAAAFDAAGVPLTRPITILQTEIACSLVRAGVGTGIVDEYTARGGVWPGLQIRPLREEIPLVPSIIRSVFGRPAVHVDKFIEILRELHGA